MIAFWSLCFHGDGVSRTLKPFHASAAFAEPARFKTSRAHIRPLIIRLSRCRAEWESYQWVCPVTNDELAVCRESVQLLMMDCLT